MSRERLPNHDVQNYLECLDICMVVPIHTYTAPEHARGNAVFHSLAARDSDQCARWTVHRRIWDSSA